MLCRGRRPRRPVKRGFGDRQEQVDVIGHNYILVYLYIGNFCAGQDILPDDFTAVCKVTFRGVEGAAPYDVAQEILSVLCTNGYEIGTRCTVIVKRQPCWFSFWKHDAVSPS